MILDFDNSEEYVKKYGKRFRFIEDKPYYSFLDRFLEDNPEMTEQNMRGFGFVNRSFYAQVVVGKGTVGEIIESTCAYSILKLNNNPKRLFKFHGAAEVSGYNNNLKFTCKNVRLES